MAITTAAYVPRWLQRGQAACTHERKHVIRFIPRGEIVTNLFVATNSIIHISRLSLIFGKGEEIRETEFSYFENIESREGNSKIFVGM